MLAASHGIAWVLAAIGLIVLVGWVADRAGFDIRHLRQKGRGRRY